MAAAKKAPRKTAAKKTARKAPAKRSYTRKKAEAVQIEVDSDLNVGAIPSTDTGLNNAASPGYTYDEVQTAKRHAVENARNGILGAEYAQANRLDHPVQLHALSQLADALLAGEAAQKALDKAKRDEQSARLIALAQLQPGNYAVNGFVFVVHGTFETGMKLSINRLGATEG